MKKSFVSAAVTITFVLYSLYQRTLGIQATPVADPSVSAIASSAPKDSPSSNATPMPVPTSTPNSTQSSPSQTVPSNTPTPIPQNTPTPAPNPGSGYKNGTYTGVAADAFYGNVQVQATISNGSLTNIQFVQWPNDRSRSVRINQQALPWLVQEAIQAQSDQVNIISGATDSSYAFVQSLQSALNQAKG